MPWGEATEADVGVMEEFRRVTGRDLKLRFLQELRALGLLDETLEPTEGSGARGRPRSTYGPKALPQIIELEEFHRNNWRMAVVVLWWFGKGHNPRERALRDAYEEVFENLAKEGQQMLDRLDQNPKNLTSLMYAYQQSWSREKLPLAKRWKEGTREVAVPSRSGSKPNRGDSEEEPTASPKEIREDLIEKIMRQSVAGESLLSGEELLDAFKIPRFSDPDGELPDMADSIEEDLAKLEGWDATTLAVMRSVTYAQLVHGRDQLLERMRAQREIANIIETADAPDELRELVGFAIEFSEPLLQNPVWLAVSVPMHLSIGAIGTSESESDGRSSASQR
ncbi:MAG: hypothetical protein WB565_10395 [Acidimicrobiales bacterium]